MCDHCDERFYGPEAAKKIEKETLKALGSLSPEDVVDLVKKTGLQESELSDVLGLGPKTIYRWRRGAQRPSKSLSILLATVAHYPKLINWIKTKAWQSIDSTPVSITSSHRRISLPHGSLQTPRLARRKQVTTATSGPRKSGEPQGASRGQNTISKFFEHAGRN